MMKKMAVLLFVVFVGAYAVYYVIDKPKQDVSLNEDVEKSSLSREQVNPVIKDAINVDKTESSIMTSKQETGVMTQPDNTDRNVGDISLKQAELNAIIEQDNKKIQQLMAEYDQDLSNTDARDKLSNEIKSNEVYRSAIIEKLKLERELETKK